jgi:hypothetical protein
MGHTSVSPMSATVIDAAATLQLENALFELTDARQGRGWTDVWRLAVLVAITWAAAPHSPCRPVNAVPCRVHEMALVRQIY